jgi:tetratricopeptide (TPR) repeat protein
VRLLLCLAGLSLAAPGQPPPPPAIASLASQASAAREANRLAEAVELYRQAVAKAPRWAEGWWYLGTLYYEQDQYPQCRGAFRRFVALETRLAPAYAMLGLCEYQTRDYPPALTHLERARTIGLPVDEPLTRVAVYHEAVLQNRAGNFEKTLRLCALLGREPSPSPEVVVVAGLAALRKPVFPQEIDPADRELIVRVGSALVPGSGQPPQEVLRRFESILQDFPAAPNVHYTFGVYLLTGDADRALAELKRELELNPNHVPALATIALELQKRGESAAGRPYAERAVAAAPSDFAARGALGRILLDMGDVPGAVRELEAAVKLEPGSPAIRFSLASAYAKAGRPQDAARQRAEFTRLKNLAESRAQPQVRP